VMKDNAPVGTLDMKDLVKALVPRVASTRDEPPVGAGGELKEI